MNFKQIFEDKTTKPKEKIETLSSSLLNGEITVSELMDFAKTSKDPVKASCIESLEFATQKNPELLDAKAFDFVVENLAAEAPRIKWESAKVIGNTATNFPKNLDNAIKNLIENTSHEGTVVRWSAAFALGNILNIDKGFQDKLLPILKKISEKEEKNSIQKIYQKAIKIAEKK